MDLLFLADVVSLDPSLAGIDPALAGGVAGSVMAFLAAFFLLSFVIGIALYVYCALAWMTIGKKLGYDKSWIAWIPIVNLFLLPILAEKHWAWGFMFLVPVANLVFFVIWTWKIFQRRGYPGALSLIPIGFVVPYLGFVASVGFLVVIGIVAWGRGNEQATQVVSAGKKK